eukprot:1139174-Pelagomonas_calceolata.AAC.2
MLEAFAITSRGVDQDVHMQQNSNRGDCTTKVHRTPKLRRFEDLEGCHSSVKQRLEAARASDDLFNRTSQRQQSLQENPPASPARRGEKIRYIPPTGFM